MDNFELRRVFLNFVAFLLIVFFYLHVALNAAMDTKRINDHRARELSRESERQGIRVVVVNPLERISKLVMEERK